MAPRRAKKAVAPGPSRPKAAAAVRLREVLASAPASPASPAAAPRRDKSLSVESRLATILHGIFLVTMAGKAQVGIVGLARGASVAVGERWMAALVRYCGFTVVLTDVLECGAAFADWLRVDMAPARQAPPGVKLMLSREGIPSVADAEAFLRQRWGKTRDWRTKMMYVPDTHVERGESSAEALHSAAPLGSSKEAAGEVNENENDEEEVANCEEFLTQISKELRASLSEEKLRAVVAQMRRDAQGDDKREQEEITKRQRRERLLSTYDLLRTLFGGKRIFYDAEELVQRVSVQNRFGDDADSVWSQLVTLARYTESGLTVLSVDCDGSVTPPTDLSKFAVGALDTLVFRWDRAAASRTQLHDILLAT